MNKLFTFGIVMILLAGIGSFVHADLDDAFHTEFAVADKFDLYGTIADDYNEGIFRIDKGIPAVFKIAVIDPTERIYRGGFTHIEDGEALESGHFHLCFNSSLSKTNDTIYGTCHIMTNHTGFYYATLLVDDDVYYFQSIEVIDALPSAFGLALLILGGLLLLIGVRFAKEFLPLGLLIFNGGIFNVIWTYQYLLSPIFIGVISLYIVLNVYIVFLMMKEW